MIQPSARKAKVPAAPGEATDDSGACDHCGDPLAGLKVVRREVGPRLQSFCCHGCAFIAEQLFLAQSGQAEAEPASAQVVAGQRQIIEVRGMVCAACGLLIEHRLRRLPGMAEAHVDFGGRRAYVAFDPDHLSRERIEAEIRAVGYRTEGGAEVERRSRRVELLRVLVAWLLMMQVMMLAIPAYMASPGEIPPDIEQLLRIAQLVLAVPVMLFSAQPLVRAAWSQVRMGTIGMDVPVVFGISTAFVASVWGTFQAQGHVYFDSVTMFVALVLGSRWLQSKGLAAAHAEVEALREQQVVFAQRLLAYPSNLTSARVAAEELAMGEKVLVPAGETVPADGVVLEGESSVSQAWLTGESIPIDRRPGDGVLAGSINLNQALVIEVTRCGDSTTLAALKRLVEEAGRERPRIVEAANRVAGVFLWVVIAVTLATLAGWWMVDPEQALPNAIAVLVATCPCALSLAAPAALSAAQSALASRGILLTRTAAIETLARVDTLACDKTGTLTTGEPVLQQTLVLRGGADAPWLAIAAALEASSTHPFALAIGQAAREAGLELPAALGMRLEASAGVEGAVEGRLWRLGKPEFALAEQPAARALVAQRVIDEIPSNASHIVLADLEGPVAVFVFGEELRPDARAFAAAMSLRGIGLMLLSGDRREPALAVGAALGIERVYAHQTPESKRSVVQQEQTAGHCVAMLGDGMNDAPVIAQADVSIALAQGSTLAQARADLLVMTSRLEEIAYSFTLSAKAMRIVRQNLGWSLIYNIGIIPAAALGYVSPAAAAVGMAASSLLVVANAFRARRVTGSQAK